MAGFLFLVLPVLKINTVISSFPLSYELHTLHSKSAYIRFFCGKSVGLPSQVKIV